MSVTAAILALAAAAGLVAALACWQAMVALRRGHGELLRMLELQRAGHERQLAAVLAARGVGGGGSLTPALSVPGAAEGPKLSWGEADEIEAAAIAQRVARGEAV